MLEVVAPIFSFSDTLFSALQSSEIDIIPCSKKVKLFIKFLQNERNEGYSKSWNKAKKIFSNKREVLEAEFHKKTRKVIRNNIKLDREFFL